MTRDAGGRCWNCHTPLSPSDYGRQESCPHCGIDTRVCKNCQFYDPSCHNECREPQAERIVDKEKANFCDYFKPNPQAGGDSGDGGGKRRDELRAAAEALFKKK